VGTTPLGENRPAVEALKAADLVIDTMFLLFSKEQLEIQAAGARMLLCMEPVEHLVQLFPTRELRERVEYGGQLLANARQLRLTNKLGTDVTYRLGTYGVITEYGYTDEPGRWDHWPSGFLFTGGADDGVDGTVVVAPGDIVYPFKTYAQTPITLTVESGRIVDIRGEFDAEIMRDYMESFDDEKAYGIAHIGWGLNEKARWSYLATDRRGLGMHGRSYYGNVLFSTGPNQEFGGTNDTQCHIDIPMRGCSLYLDDLPIVVDGDIAVEEMKAPSRVMAAR
jgi:2,5-dihydroxypyridine 5,6-dioxygenase